MISTNYKPTPPSYRVATSAPTAEASQAQEKKQTELSYPVKRTPDGLKLDLPDPRTVDELKEYSQAQSLLNDAVGLIDAAHKRYEGTLLPLDNTEKDLNPEVGVVAYKEVSRPSVHHPTTTKYYVASGDAETQALTSFEYRRESASKSMYNDDKTQVFVGDCNSNSTFYYSEEAEMNFHYHNIESCTPKDSDETWYNERHLKMEETENGLIQLSFTIEDTFPAEQKLPEEALVTA